MRLWSLLAVLVLSLSQFGCSDDQTGNQDENTSAEDVATDATHDSATDAEPDADLDGGCTPGEMGSDECDNVCTCTDAGTWQCTLRECSDDAGYSDDTSDADQASDADDTSSTADASDPEDADETSDGGDTSADAGCTQGDTKEVDCNTCTCMSDGTWACTKMDCAYDPCAGKSCGDNCTICPPDDPNCVETDVVKTCGTDGTCSAGLPRC